VGWKLVAGIEKPHVNMQTTEAAPNPQLVLL